MSDNRPIAYREGDISIYRGSGVGSCVKALVAAMQGYEENRSEFTDRIMSAAAAEGNLHEPAVVEALKEMGWKVGHQQDQVDIKIVPRVFIRFHPDGIGRPPRARKDRVIEIKSMSKTRYKKWLSYPDAATALVSPEFIKYGYQISSEMHFYAMEAEYVVKNRDSGELNIQHLKTPPISWSQIRRRIIEAEKWRKKGELPGCDVDAAEKFFCPFPYLHDDLPFAPEEDDENAPVDSVTQAVIVGLAEHHHRLSKDIKRGKMAEEERKDVNKRINELVPKGMTVVAGGFKVLGSGNTRSYLNTGKLAEKLGIDVSELKDLISQSQDVKESRFPRVTKVD